MCMNETTCLDSVYKFCITVIVVFGEVYMRKPNVANTERLLLINESKVFDECSKV
jgi:hypothetical protein